ncbi:hypothetical protein BH10CHL1_BH10CHL1_15340 [soil metagenome]
MVHPQSKPAFSSSEYPLRWQKARGMMAAQAFDLLIAWADDFRLQFCDEPRTTVSKGIRDENLGNWHTRLGIGWSNARQGFYQLGA